MRVLIHMMPWFDLGQRDNHWTMQLFEQDSMFLHDRYRTTGRIAAHYTPLIGPYDSADVDTIDLQLDLMREAGADGIILNFYGATDLSDYGKNRRAADAILGRVARTNLSWTLCYEDRTIDDALPAAEQRQRLVDDWKYIRDSYIATTPNVLRRDGTTRPTFMVFGPDLSLIHI